MNSVSKGGATAFDKTSQRTESDLKVCCKLTCNLCLSICVSISTVIITVNLCHLLLQVQRLRTVMGRCHQRMKTQRRRSECSSL